MGNWDVEFSLAIDVKKIATFSWAARTAWPSGLRRQTQVLMVQTSYGKGYGLPGGGLHPGESAREAAVRELNESWGWRSKAAGCRSHGRSQNNNEAGATR